MPDRAPIRRALLSVSDKTGLPELAQGLAAAGVELVSTGGTARALRETGLAVRDVAALTGFPEMLDGRVKTLHPAVHGGLLARRADPAHVAALEAQGIGAIDLLAVDLYPFEAAVAAGAPPEACVEQIDIGGPALIRAAAKNHADVTVLTDPQDYAELLDALPVGGPTLAQRRRLAAEAYARTAAYDAAVSAWMAAQAGLETPRRRTAAGRLAAPLRYGENPHQRAAFYVDGADAPGPATAEIAQGKPLSYNNILDADAAWAALIELTRPEFGGRAPCVIVKHANPCGAALAETPGAAWRAAYDCDRTSAFGGVVAFAGEIDAAAARAATSIFTEVVIAPAADAAARAMFAEKPNLRLLLTGGVPDPAAGGLAWRQVAGGWLIQDRDAELLDGMEVVTRRAPSEAERADMLFAWAAAKHVKSNAIVYAKDGRTVGVGAGQMSRVDSTRVAAAKAAEMGRLLGLPGSAAEGSAVASDAFFPFADGLEAAAEAGATAVIQPGGSLRDGEVIEAADARGVAMAFTGTRHFRH